MLRIITATREIRNPVVACCRALKLRVARAYSRGEDNGASMKAALALWCYGTLILTAGCGGDATGTGGDHHPVRLAFVVQPNASSAGISLAPSVEIAVQDAQGQLDTTATTAITVAITPGTGDSAANLRGTLTRAAVKGIASFSDLTIDKVAAGYSLRATATGLTGATSTTFAITAGAAAQLVFAVQPSTVTAGSAIAPGVRIAIEDTLHNIVTSSAASITLGITSGTGTNGAALSGTLTRSAVSGVATFNNLAIDKAGGGYTLTATASNLTSATSAAFAVNVGPAAKLVFTVQPSAGVAGNAITPVVHVTVQDASGNTVATSTANITVAITTGTGTTGATLSGTKTHAAASGVAAFNDLVIDKSGTGYTLTATAASLTSATSTAFGIDPNTPHKLAFRTQPTSTPIDSLMVTVEVAIRDSLDNSVPSASANITVSITPGTGDPGATLSGTLNQSGTGSVAFPDLSIDKLGTGYTLTATASGLTNAVSAPFGVAGALTELAAGVLHTCSVSLKALQCWGANDYGQLGIGAADVLTHPLPLLAQGTLPRSIAAGGFNTCDLLTGGGAFCWGENASGQIGDSSQTNRAAPVAVKGGLVFASITSAGPHTCGLLASGAAYCWGENFAGQVGDSTVANRSAPVPVAGGLTFSMLSAGGGGFTCGLTSGGDAYCWGYNSQGELGIGHSDTDPHPVPTAVLGGLKFSTISSGSGHVCAIATPSGDVYCWGGNALGQLGDGGNQPAFSPQTVNGLSGATTVVANLAHTCVLVGAGDALCWGGGSANSWNKGQLGTGDNVDRPFPTPVLGGLQFRSLTAGEMYTCGVTTRGLAYCWGFNNWGQIGVGTTQDVYSPALVHIP
jgi:alpha-tubulin suppressor-like RCC1 family protein